jgi:hypothetical protein
MLKTWIPRIVRVIEPHLDSGLADVVLLRVEFLPAAVDSHSASPPPQEVIERSCTVDVDQERSTATVHVGDQFELGLAHPTNISERVLVARICDAFSQLANVPFAAAELRDLELQIVESDDARQMHSFQARKYRDFVQGNLRGEIIRPDDRDMADVRCGLAFRAESREAGRSSLRSKRQCTRLLNAIIRDLEDEVCSELRQFVTVATSASCVG